MRAWMTIVALLAAVGLAGAGEQYALLVGIDRVPGIGSEFDLKYAESDVRQLKEALVDQGFYAAENVHLLTGSAARVEEQARKNIIQARIQDVLARRLEPDDVLLVYLAMHGTLLKEGGETRRAFLPADAVKGLGSTYVTDKELGEWLARVPARKVVVLDVCFAGGKGTRFFRDESNRALIVPTFERGDPLARSAQAVITASGRDEPAQDGVLARALEETLADFSSADRDGDRRLSAGELYQALGRRVQGQHPELLPGYQEVDVVDGATGYLSVETRPPGARVWFGAELLGETPLSRKPVKAVTDGLRVEKDGFEDYRVAALTVRPGYGNVRSFELQRRMGRISGKVVDGNGRGVPSAVVTLLGATGINAVTDAEGGFRLGAPFARYSGVTVKAEGYREATFSEGISVDIGRPAFAFARMLVLEQAVGTLYITSAPSGAQVFVDGRLVGRTPLRQEWPAGAYELRLEGGEGIRPRTESIVVRDQQELRREIALEERAGLLVVNCGETDAVVYLDDQSTGLSLATLRQGYRLPAGTHAVRVTKPNFADFAQRVTIQENQTTRVQAELVRGGAYLSLRNLPQSARVQVRPASGRELEFFGPVERQSVPAGEVAVVASAAGYEGWQERFVVRQGEAKVLVPGLARRSRVRASLRALALPSWGQFYGERPGRGALVLLGSMGAAGAFGYAQMQYSSVEKDYQAAIERYNSATTFAALRQAEQEVGDTFDELDRWHQVRQLGAGALAALWGYGVLDALIIGPVAPASVSLQPVSGRAGTRVVWRF